MKKVFLTGSAIPVIVIVTVAVWTIILIVTTIVATAGTGIISAV